MGITVTDFHRLFCRFDLFKNPLKMDVTVSVCCGLDCRRFGLCKMDVAVMVCRRFGLPLFQPVAVSVCRRFDSFKMDVAVMVCRRFRLSPFRFVTVLTVLRIKQSVTCHENVRTKTRNVMEKVNVKPEYF